MSMSADPTTPAAPPPHLAYSPAAERNQVPILQVLSHVLAASGSALEIASGTGQHTACFAAAFPGWRWQPTDWQDTLFSSIVGWSEHLGARHVLPPLRLDVTQEQWPADGPVFAAPFDLIYCANMLHIAPWECCAGLMRGAARHLQPDGVLVTYGPYLEADVPTAESNLAFDAALRAQDSRWGIRALGDVQEQARRAGLQLAQRHALPANNLLLVWQRMP